MIARLVKKRKQEKSYFSLTTTILYLQLASFVGDRGRGGGDNTLIWMHKHVSATPAIPECVRYVHQIREKAHFLPHTAHPFLPHCIEWVCFCFFLLSFVFDTCLSATHTGSSFVVCCRKCLNWFQRSESGTKGLWNAEKINKFVDTVYFKDRHVKTNVYQWAKCWLNSRKAKTAEIQRDAFVFRMGENRSFNQHT